MIKASFGARLDAWIHRLFPFLFRRSRPIDPNLLTCTGAVVAVAAALMLAAGQLRLGGALILASGFFDLVDGVVARHYGVSTEFGSFLDATLDRLVDVVLLCGVLAWYAGEGDRATAAVAAVALATAVLTSYAKARAETRIPVLEGGLLERGERIGLLAAGALFDVLAPVLWLLAAGGVVTVAQRFAVAYRALGDLDATRRGASPAGPQREARSGGASAPARS